MIPDTHYAPAGWGIRPVLFSIAGHPVTSYAFFVLLGLVAATAMYAYNTRAKSFGNIGPVIAIAALVGGILGAKLPIWVANAGEILAHPTAIAWLSGRTIVGGLVGGVLAVWLVRRRLGVKQRLGNYFVPSICIGIAIGRLGCFFTGCCYGTPTRLPWGINFGDHIARHPTQLYEALFASALFVVAQATLERWEPGRLFDAFMITYFSWRFLVEFIRVNPIAGFGLTYYQLAAGGIMLVYLAKLYLESMKGRVDERDAAA